MGSPLILLPLLAFLASVAIARKATGDWLAAVPCGAIAWGCFVVLICEALSPARLITPAAVVIAWTLFLIAAVILLVRLRSRHSLRFSLQIPATTTGKMTGAFIVIALGVTAVVAWLGEPSRWDVLTYHMPRVAHWAQNESVLFFPTHNERQIWSPPAASYIMLQFFLLSGGSDAAAAFVPWAAYAGCILLAALITRELGGERRSQAIAALVALTTPGAIAQASGGQVDIITAFWLLSAAWLGVRITWSDRTSWPLVVLAGGSVGLALLTKGTAYPLVFPFLAWFLVALARRRPRHVLPIAAIVIPIVLVMVIPQYTRNAAVFRRGLRGPNGDQTLTTRRTPAVLASNVMRNTALHFGTRVPAIDEGLHRAVARAHRAIGVSLDDTATTWSTSRFVPVRHSFSDERGGSPLHLLLLPLATVGLVLTARRTRKWTPAVFALATCVSYLMFCLTIKWQPWHARMHLPVLLLGAAPVGLWLGALRPRISNVVAAVLAIAALPVFLLHPDRALILARQVHQIPRSERYFMQIPEMREPYIAAARILRRTGCDRIGMWLGGDDIEYPIWALLRNDGGPMPEIRHVQVLNVSRKAPLEHDTWKPCAIVHIDNIGWPPVFRIPAGFTPVWKNRGITILTRSIAA